MKFYIITAWIGGAQHPIVVFFFFFLSSKYQQYSATELVRFSSFVAMHLSFIPKILVGSYNKNIEGNYEVTKLGQNKTTDF